MTVYCNPRGNLNPFWAPQKFFWLNLTRILWFFWNLGFMLFDIPQDVVFAEILIFSSIFGFPVVNWAPKWTKTINIGRVPFEPKCKILKDFSNSFCLIGDNLWSKFQQDWTIFGGVRAQNTQKGVISWMLNRYKKLWTFLTAQPDMLYWWKLPRTCILIRSFISLSLGA